MQGFDDPQHRTALGSFFITFGNFGVDIFFVISGFIMFYTLRRGDSTARDFLLRRAIRIVPAYWAITLLFIPVVHVFGSPFTSMFGWTASSLAQSPLFIPHENPSGIGRFPLLTLGWTLNFEKFFYVWLSLMLLVFRRAWFVACAVSMSALPLVWNQQWPYASIVSSSLLYEFVAGMCVGALYVRTRALERRKGALLAMMFLLAGIGLCWAGAMRGSVFDFANAPFFWRLGNLAFLLSAATFVCAALGFEQHLSGLRMLRLLRHLGDISYSTYLVHPVSLCIAVYLFGQPQSVFHELSAIGAYTFMTLALSHLSYRCIETGPVTEFLKRALPARRVAGA